MQIDDKNIVNPSRFDFGWLYLITGLLITVVALCLPAMFDLERLKIKADASNQLLLEHEETYVSYINFFEDLKSGDELVLRRIRQIQLNEDVDGTPIVTDLGASKTPLQWIDEKNLKVTSLKVDNPKETSLYLLLKGTGRLWMASFGVFFIFIGCLNWFHAAMFSLKPLSLLPLNHTGLGRSLFS